MKARMRIGEFAEVTGVVPRLLRYYEDQGLLHPGRDDHGWRVYTPDDTARVRDIRSLIEAGLPTKAISQLITASIDHSRAVSEQLRAELVAVRDRLDARIRCLARNRDALDAWLRALPSSDR